MSTEMTLNFCSKNRATEDFMKMIWNLEEVKKLLEEAINLNTGKHLADFMRQDIKTLEDAKIAILDEKIAEKLEEMIEEKKLELKGKETRNYQKMLKVLDVYKEFESYSKIVKKVYDSCKEILSINIDKMNTEEHLAFLFADIRLDAEESASECYYEKASIIYTDGLSAIKALSEER